MASNQQQSKKMEYRKVSGFDVSEIAPDAPAGEWTVSIPRGKCKVQPTKDNHDPMIIVPIRLDATEEDGEMYEKALGTELSVFLVFGGKDARAERLQKVRIRQLCEAADVDLEDVPKDISDPENDLEPFIKKLEGKKFTAWTIVKPRKDTGEITTEVQFFNPTKVLSAADEDEDEGGGDDDEEGSRPARGKKKPDPKKSSNGKSRR